MSRLTGSVQPLTSDAFLGGRLTLTQPGSGYRAGVDPVFLAASVSVKPGASVLDLGCGVGTAGLCLGSRCSGLKLTGVEVQPDYAELARANARENGQAMRVFCDDIFHPGQDWAREAFDVVLTNPPYFEPGSRTPSPTASRETGLAERQPLTEWLDIAIRRVSPGGMLAVIQRAERLGDLLTGLDDRMGAVDIRPLAPRAGKPARLVIVRATKGARGPLTLNAPVIVHEGEHHLKDGDSYSPEVSAILRDGAAWPWVKS